MSLTCLPTSARTRARAALRASSSRARAKSGERLERELGVHRQQPRIARQADDAIGPGAVGERELEVVSPRRQAVAHDRLHAPLAEGAARLLVGENVLQRHHFARHVGQARLRRVDHRETFIEPAETLAGRLRLGVRAPRRAAPRHYRAGRRRRGQGPPGATRAIRPGPQPAVELGARLASAAKRSSIASCALPPLLARDAAPARSAQSAISFSAAARQAPRRRAPGRGRSEHRR